MKKWHWSIFVAHVLIVFSASMLPAQDTADGDGIIEAGENAQ
jgi:hypothetical protein